MVVEEVWWARVDCALMASLMTVLVVVVLMVMLFQLFTFAYCPMKEAFHCHQYSTILLVNLELQCNCNRHSTETNYHLYLANQLD